MQFREFAENLLGSRVKVKIISRLLTDETLTSERELAQLIGASPGAVNRVLKDFHGSNLISPMRIGAATVWNLNKQSYAYQFLIGFPNMLKEQPLEDLKNQIRNQIRLAAVKKIVLFGSIAEGNEKPRSDIDLFILVEDGPNAKNAFEPINWVKDFFIQRYGNQLSPHIFTPKDLEDPQNKKLLESVSRGIILVGQ